MDNLPKCGANYVPLTPLTFLKRAARVYSNRTSIIYGGVRFTWQQTYERCCRLASALLSLNIVKKHVVSVLAPNIPAMYEMNFAVPMAGAVLNTINTRLDAKNIATILKHSEAKILFADYQYLPLARDALRILAASCKRDSGTHEISMPLVVVIDDLNSPTGVRLGSLESKHLMSRGNPCDVPKEITDEWDPLTKQETPMPPVVAIDNLNPPTSIRFGELEYEHLVSRGNPCYVPEEIADEWDPIALNYTSGTTSEPKGVVYSHRGAYLSTLSLILGWEMKMEPVYLWSLPMFHCNGWTFTWGVAARGGTNVCIRNTTAAEMYENIAAHRVTHMCCAPIVFNILLGAKPHERRPIPTSVEILTGGAPPPAALLQRIEKLGFHVVHAYGLTEATGPALVCEWQQRWNKLPAEEQAKLKARQGVSILTMADVDVKDPEMMTSVSRDGKAIGEIMLRGSGIMKGYLKDEKATAKAFRNGWFLTGDVGVIHHDGYIEIKDRSKDVIISGGENISSVEVEAALYTHPEVVEAAVVAMPHPKWGESPCAFVTLRKSGVEEADIVQHCKNNLPGFMVPKKVVFVEELPKTSTGKVQKFQLRALAKTFAVSSDQSSEDCSSSPSSSTKRPGNWEMPGHNYHHHNQGQVLALSRL